MVGAFSPNARRPSPGSWLSNWLAKRARHPDSFDCGVKVTDGAIDDECGSWRFRVSGADQWIDDGVVTLHHGTKVTLRLLVDQVPSGELTGNAARRGHVIFAATERNTGARVHISVDIGEVARFGLEG